MGAMIVPNSLFALEERNKLATAVIKKYARRHAWTDVIMGLLSSVVPGGGILASAASIAIQAQAFYKPMVRELAEIYSASPDDVTNGVIGAATGVGAVTEFLVNEFGTEFMQEIVVDIVQDLGLSMGLSWIPVIGKLLGAGADAAVATALTWAVGSMAVVYFLNGEQFFGSRKETYLICKKIDLQATEDPDGVSLNDLPWKIPQLLESMVTQLLRYIASTRAQLVLNFLLSLLSLTRPKPLSAEEIHRVLEPNHVPARLVDEVVQRGTGKVIAAAV